MKKIQKPRVTSLIRDVENFLKDNNYKHFRLPKPTDTENDVYVIEEKK